MKSNQEGDDFHSYQDIKNYRENIVYFNDVNVGDEITPLIKEPVTRTQIVRYAGASKDFNPMHHDEPLAQAAGMKGVFAHGMISMAFLGQMIKDWCGHERLRKLKVRFNDQVRPGDIITCRGKVTKKYTQEGKNLVEADIFAQNQNNVIVTSGFAVIELPIN
ncbi:MAG: bifunctional enoyl-CoA hydratase/phosphate acetyltransferase [Smithella sp. PtaU1.Bin162]|nr:MAG: bifunctional enoyl-CoA hydratase/phosphate acetyltransferase [Smithella sp. PtaU1.Bin162]